MNKCKECSRETINPTFCSRRCSSISNNRSRGIKKHTCINCKEEYIPKSPKSKYCSHTCQNEFQHKEFIQRWLRGEESGMKGKLGISSHIRTYLFKKYENKCSKCSWGEVNPHSNLIPLEINHIDGIHTNNDEDNLELLCPNCHSLTHNYKSRNKNSTRTYRYK